MQNILGIFFFKERAEIAQDMLDIMHILDELSLHSIDTILSWLWDVGMLNKNNHAGKLFKHKIGN